MTLLLEYGLWTRIENAPDLRRFLQDLWTEDPDQGDKERTEVELDYRYQPFVTFDGNQIRANNYVGFIQNGQDLIEIYPKVFRGIENLQSQKSLMPKHMFFWFNYCRKWRFPFTDALLDIREIDTFPELIINLIARQFFDSISTKPLQLYQSIEQSLQFPRGSINFARYTKRGLSTGNQHVLECDLEPFLYDNRVNRIIKHCSRLLMNQTQIAENLRLLQEVVFILDDVEDVKCTIQDVNTSNINAFFGEYSRNLEICRMILANQLYSSDLNDLSHWCLLFPMEYIFEDFVAGFIDRKFGNRWKIEYQKSDKYLVDQPDKVFRMQHDVFLSAKGSPESRIVVDTKYKLRDPKFKIDRKRGVSQTDLYQMVSYAYKRGCSDVLLLYPNVGELQNGPDVFYIESGFAESPLIKVTAAEIPFWSENSFEGLENALQETISTVLSEITN